MPNRTSLYERISRPSGGLAMIAIDQRESLRTMFREHLPAPIGNDTLVEFKIAVAELLSGYASAMLFDRLYGWQALEVAKSTSPGCGIIVSADKLIQEPGQAVLDTDQDLDLDPEEARQRGAVALKILLVWKGVQNSKQCRTLAQAFMSRCRDAGLLGIIEAIVRIPDGMNTDDWNREDAIVEAARELGSVQPDLYKAEVPLYGSDDPAEIQVKSEAITAVLPCPWVVLSSGVEAECFPSAVEAACRGGASGFLAGRGIWQDAIRANAKEFRSRLQAISIQRLVRLAAIVDKTARPWYEVIQN